MSVLERAEQLIELRCPIGPKALLAKSVLLGDPAHVNPELNLMELNCRDCGKVAKRQDPKVRRVVHRFNALGQLVESFVQRDED